MDNLTRQQRYYRRNREALLAKAKAKRQKPEEKEKSRTYNKEYYTDNKEKSNATSAAYYKENKERIAERKRLTRLAKPKEERQRIDRERRERRKPQTDYNREYSRRTRAENPEAAIKNKLSSRIRVAIKQHQGGKSLKSEELLGASIPEVMKHLESQFQEGMTWENHGRHGWHIDHIMPCASFDLTLESEQKKCFNYKNLQPLWWHDNLIKSDKIIAKDCHKDKTKKENQQRRKNKK